MANTYNDATGVLIFDGPSVITPVIRVLFTPFKLDETPEESGNEHYVAILSEDNNYDWDTYTEELRDVAERDFGIDFKGCDAPADTLKALAAHFNAQIEGLLPSIDFDGYVLLSELVALALLFEDGHNLVGLAIEGCWHCDKPRLGEFGGWSTFASSHYFISLATSELSAFARAVDAAGNNPAATAKVLGAFIQKLVDGIHDPGLRAQINQLLMHDLKEEPNDSEKP